MLTALTRILSQRLRIGYSLGAPLDIKLRKISSWVITLNNQVIEQGCQKLYQQGTYEPG